MPYFKNLKRRHFIRLSLGTLISFLGDFLFSKVPCLSHTQQVLDDPNRDFSFEGSSTLKEGATAKKLIYGVSARQDHLRSDPEFAGRLTEEASLLVPEWALKWAAGDTLLRPSPSQFDFSAPDFMFKFATRHNLLVRGHALIWHDSLPKWFDDFVNHKNAQQVLEHHINTVVGRYAGKVHSWDVVNEAIAYDPRKSWRSDGLRNTAWLKYLGTDYIDLAFRTAAAADPNALLVYNDFGLDYDSPLHEAKRTATLRLLRHLKAKGTPIHALGIQAHLKGEATNFNPRKLQRFLHDVAELDLKILITELDVADKKLPAEVEQRDRIIAGIYEDYLSAVLSEPAVIAVITWGLSDRYSYLSEFKPRPDGKPVRPLPLDTNLKPKLAWNGIMRAFNSIP